MPSDDNKIRSRNPKLPPLPILKMDRQIGRPEMHILRPSFNVNLTNNVNYNTRLRGDKG